MLKLLIAGVLPRVYHEVFYFNLMYFLRKKPGSIGRPFREAIRYAPLIFNFSWNSMIVDFLFFWHKNY